MVSRSSLILGSASRFDESAWIRIGGSVFSHWEDTGTYVGTRHLDLDAEPRLISSAAHTTWDPPLGSTMRYSLPSASGNTSCSTLVNCPACEDNSNMREGGIRRSYHRHSAMPKR